MNKENNCIPEDDYRMISELQHFAFCRRQWALIHIEQQWAENLRTTEGELMHKRVHNADATELRNDKLIVRGMRVVSHTLGCSGICDAVEFYRSENGISLHGREGKWTVRPVEYKKGRPKEGNEDRLQLCAQAICLEEMLCCSIPEGDLFYGEPHRRAEVKFTDPLRNEVQTALNEMNMLFRRGYTPSVKRRKHCNACSLKDICLPILDKKESVKEYISRYCEEDL